MTRLAIVLGDCLFPSHETLCSTDKETRFFMAEDYGLCTHYRYHIQKLLFFLASMRAHGDSLAANHPLTYWELDDATISLSFEEKLSDTISQHEITELAIYRVDDHFFRERLQHIADTHRLPLHEMESPKFLTPPDTLASFFKRKRLLLNDFYIQQRQRLNILLQEDGSPVGGAWHYDQQNRKALPKTVTVPERKKPHDNPHLPAVRKLIERHFSTHPGSLTSFQWETTRDGALGALKDFLTHRFDNFGPYQDAITNRDTFLFHSTLSPYLNNGLLIPEEVVSAALDAYAQGDVSLASCEGFIRQIIGWREFLKGVYEHRSLQGNFFGHHRELTADWYAGTTGLPPVDDAIKRVLAHGYLHHIDRLMVISNAMLLSGIHPDSVYRWFMELFVDSADWVMVPNVYGMGQFADGGTFATKPYISGANYLLKMSDYSRGAWCDVWDGLYWRFIETHESFFQHNHRLRIMVKALHRLDPEKKKRIFKQADAFIASKTK